MNTPTRQVKLAMEVFCSRKYLKEGGREAIASFATFGGNSVHMFAPGYRIVSSDETSFSDSTTNSAYFSCGTIDFCSSREVD